MRKALREKITKEIKVTLVYREYDKGMKSLSTKVNGKEAQELPKEVKKWILRRYLEDKIKELW